MDHTPRPTTRERLSRTEIARSGSDGDTQSEMTDTNPPTFDAAGRGRFGRSHSENRGLLAMIFLMGVFDGPGR